jgi:hypothetical protein
MQEAEELSLKHRRNIIVGDNSFTETMDFDRDKVQFLNIPRINYISILHEKIAFGMHQSIIYENEFFVLKDNTKLFVNNLLIKSLYEERHKIKFIFSEFDIGLNVFELIVNGQIKESGKFYAD